MASMKLQLHLLVTFLLCVCCVCEDRPIDGSKLGEELKRLGDEGLGVQFMQDLVNKAEILTSHIPGAMLVNQSAMEIAETLQNVRENVIKLRDHLEEAYNNNGSFGKSNTDGIQKCCDIDESDLEHSSKYDRHVDPNAICYKSPSGSPVIPVSEDTRKMMMNVARAAEASIWQYFGTAEGVTVTYPARNIKSDQKCSEFDPRDRAWYVQAAAPAPKDVVICLDRSGSFTSRWDDAKSAVSTVFNTLNGNDRVALVPFNHEATSIPKCTNENNRLAYATQEVKDEMEEHLKDILPREIANYFNPIVKAAKLFKTPPPVDNGETRVKVLLFITDGATKNEAFDDTVEYIRANLKDVTVFTFSLGGENNEEFLESMATANSMNGFHRHVNSSQSLRALLVDYYNVFYDNQRNSNVIITTPFVDYEGLGHMLASCLPVYQTIPELEFKGVACINILLSTITSGVEFFSDGEYSYGFIMERSGRAIIHPLLPKPTQSRYTFLDIENLEPHVKINVTDHMKLGAIGKYTIDSHVTISRGNNLYQGIHKFPTNLTYYFQPVKETPYSICLVISDIDRTFEVLSDGSPNHFVYHRLDLYNDTKYNIEKCKHFGKLSTKGRMTTKLTTGAFVKAFSYLTADEIKEELTSYINFMKDGTNTNPPYIKKGVDKVMSMVGPIEDFWNAQGEEYGYLAIWRYFGVKPGLVCVYPGLAHNKEYDFRKRDWYKMTVVNCHKYVVGPPYKDYFGAGIVVTLSHVIVMNRSVRKGCDKEDKLLGVMGMDFSLSHFDRLLRETFKACDLDDGDDSSCFLVDDSGYIVHHKDILNAKDIPFIHLHEKAPYIANDLETRRQLTRSVCLHIEDKSDYHSWRLNVEEYYENDYYAIDPVQNTNLYIILEKKLDLPKYAKWTCPKDMTSCQQKPFNKCPCKELNSVYDTCKNNFASQTQDLCVPHVGHLSQESPVKNEKELVKDLKPCMICKFRSANEGMCVENPHCKWCGDNICTDDSMDCPEKSSTNVLAIVLPVVLIAILLIVIVILVILYRKKRLPRISGIQRDPDDDYYTVGQVKLNKDPDSDAPSPPARRVSTLGSNSQWPPVGSGYDNRGMDKISAESNPQSARYGKAPGLTTRNRWGGVDSESIDTFTSESTIYPKGSHIGSHITDITDTVSSVSEMNGSNSGESTYI